ncbi:unnamed protein product, partial [marine sediment metagenome]
PYECADICETCWGNGKAFGDICTPRHINFNPSGYGGGDADFNGSFILTQTPFHSCVFDYNDGEIFAEVIFGEGATQFTIGHVGMGDDHVIMANKCSLFAEEEGGQIVLQIDKPATPDWKFGIDQNFSPSMKTVHEDLGPGDDGEVIRLCYKPDGICIYIAYEPDY